MTADLNDRDPPHNSVDPPDDSPEKAKEDLDKDGPKDNPSPGLARGNGDVGCTHDGGLG